jgi:hypothetical protein
VWASLAKLMRRAKLLDKLSEAGRVTCTRRRYNLHLAGANGRDLATRPGWEGERLDLGLVEETRRRNKSPQESRSDES